MLFIMSPNHNRFDGHDDEPTPKLQWQNYCTSMLSLLSLLLLLILLPTYATATTTMMRPTTYLWIWSSSTDFTHTLSLCPSHSPLCLAQLDSTSFSRSLSPLFYSLYSLPISFCSTLFSIPYHRCKRLCNSCALFALSRASWRIWRTDGAPTVYIAFEHRVAIQWWARQIVNRPRLFILTKWAMMAASR